MKNFVIILVAIVNIIMFLLIIEHYIREPNMRGRHMKHIHSSKLFRLPNLDKNYAEDEDEKILLMKVWVMVWVWVRVIVRVMVLTRVSKVLRSAPCLRIQKWK